MKKILFILSIVLFANVLSAQTDAKAKQILDQVSQKTRSYKTIKAGAMRIVIMLFDEINFAVVDDT